MKLFLDGPEEVPAEGPCQETSAETVEGLRRRGLRSFLHGDYTQAAAHFTAALKLAPFDSALYANRGDAYRHLCEYERAIADYDAALQRQPTDATLLVRRATAYHHWGYFEPAIADSSAALEVQPQCAEAYGIRASAYAGLEKYDLVLADWTAVIGLKPENDGAFFERAEIYAAQRDFALAIADFDRVLQLNPYHLRAYLRRGDAHLGQRNYFQAISDYTEVLARHPHHVVALSSRGRVYQVQGDAERALADYTEALRLDPGSPLVYFRRGILYRAKGKLTLAQADLDESLRLEPDNAATHYHRGMILLAQRRFALALADLDAVVSLRPKFAVGYLSRALIYDCLRQYPQGEADCTRALALKANTPAAFLLRGVIHLHRSDHAAAIADLTQALEYDALLALAYQQRSIAYTFQGEFERALADCHRLVALEPGNAQAYVNRSIVYHYQGQIQPALTDYARALQIDPKRVMTGWNQDLAEAALHQTTHRIADYIEGLRPEAHLDGNPPATPFVIVVESAKATADRVGPLEEPKAPARIPHVPDLETSAGNVEIPEKVVTPPLEPEAADTLVNIRVDETATYGQLPASTDLSTQTLVEVPAQRLADKPRPVARFRSDSPATKERILEKKGRKRKAASPPSSTPLPRESRPMQDEVKPPSAEGEVAAVALEQEIEVAIHEILADSGKGSETSESAAKATDEAPPANHTPPKPAAVECPICRWSGAPDQTLPGGRFRCGHCKAVFVRSPAAQASAPFTAPPRAPNRKPLKKADDDDENMTFLEAWKKTLTVGVGSVAALSVIYIFFFLSGSDSERPSVNPVQGKIEFEGKPIPLASIVLHPIDVKAPPFPRPRGIVKDDGSFVLGTYREDDGAPAGDYKLTVQWYKKATLKELEGGRLPPNLLPSKYATAETSGLTLQIHPGENQLPALRLKR